MKEQVREEPKIIAAAELQMQAWSRSAESNVALDDSVAIAARLKPYVAISREAGAGGSPVAQLVGETLGWEVLDRNILDRVSQRYKLPRQILEMVDETQANWAYDILGTWLDPKVIPHEKYVIHLGHVVLAAACQASVVYVGRGVQFLLPRDRGLAVRIIASESYRANRIAEREGISIKEATKKMHNMDVGRRAFVQRFFHQDIDDPHLYDLVINVERCCPKAAAECIVASFRR